MKLLRDNVILELPPETGSHERQHKSGITLSFSLSDEEKYAPVSGIVRQKGRLCDDLNIGDKVYYHYLSYLNAQNTLQQYDKGHFDPYKTTWKDEGKHWLLMPSIELICVERDGELIALNQYVLLKSISKNLTTGRLKGYRGENLGEYQVQNENATAVIILPEFGEKYRTDIAEVVSGKGFQKGQVVYLYPEWDVPLERDILDLMPEPVYYTNSDTIIGIKEPIDATQN